MPESGRYEKRPRPEQKKFFTRALLAKPVVSDVQEIDDHHFMVFRYGKNDLYVYLTNKYLLSVADVMEIMEDSPDIDCVVSTMNYNQYSKEAKEYCRDMSVGLFISNEFFGAVFYDGDRFLDYVPPRKRQ